LFFTLCLMSAGGSCSMTICWCGQFLTVLWNGNSWFGYFVALLYIYLSMLWQFVTTTFLMMLEIACDYNLLNQESWQRHKSSQFVWWFRDGIACDHNCLCLCGEFWHSRDNNTLLQCSGLLNCASTLVYSRFHLHLSISPSSRQASVQLHHELANPDWLMLVACVAGEVALCQNTTSEDTIPITNQ
jgi:hypothetical protein